MTPLFKKLQFKDGQIAVVIDAPDSFLPEMEAMAGLAAFQNSFQKSDNPAFALAFATRHAEVAAFAASAAANTEGDATVWVAFPKGSSKRLRCEFNRDTGWAVFGQLGFEPVRSVAIDEDWTALRFRRVLFITEMTRSFSVASGEPVPKRPTSERPAIVVPGDLAAALDRSPAARAVFDNYAYTHRKEYVRWIEEAKRPETRARRVEKSVDMLLEKKKLS